jgi:hypothetical protein
MKFMKWLVPLAIVIMLLAIALPASAQGPTYTAGASVHVRTYNGPLYIVTPGTNEDPFGGLPRPGSGGVPGALGAPGNFGQYPWNSALPGGVPSNRSGDGSTPRKAIYIGGPWSDLYPAGEAAWELPACVTVKIPAATSKWVKADTWRNRQLIYWVDDELNDATKPSGVSVFGAANRYMYGTAPGDAWSVNENEPKDTPNSQTGINNITGPFLSGFSMAIYDPTVLGPNYYFNPPNASILTLSVSGSGSLRRSAGNVSLSGLVGTVPHGFAQFNVGEPQHLIWYDGNFDGWTFARVYNQMIWDAVASVCSYRHVQGR